MKHLNLKIVKVLAFFLILFNLSAAKANIDFSFGVNFNFNQWYNDYYEPCSSFRVVTLPVVWRPNIYYSWESYESDWLWVNFNFFKSPRNQYYCEPVYYSYYPYQTACYNNYFNSCYYNNSSFRHGYYCPTVKIINYNIYRNRNYCPTVYVPHHKHNKKEHFRHSNQRQRIANRRRKLPAIRSKIKGKIKPINRPIVRERRPVKRPIVKEIRPIKRPIVRERRPIKRPIVKEIRPIKRPIVRERIRPVKRPIVKEIRPIKRPVVKKRIRPAKRPVVKRRVRPAKRRMINKRTRPKVINSNQTLNNNYRIASRERKK